MDDDLETMTPEQLKAEVIRLRSGIREHRDSTGHDLCWHHPDLWNLLPEQTQMKPWVPEWPRFMEGCIRYRASLDRELPDAPRRDVGYEEPRTLQSRRGSCHCGGIRFEIKTDFPELTTCDCSICRRKNALMVKVHESQFRLLAGEELLTAYQFHTHTATHYFCRVCGIYPFHRKRVTPDHFGVNVFCLEDFDPAGIPVRATVGAGMA